MTIERSLSEFLDKEAHAVATALGVTLERALSAFSSPPLLSKSTRKHIAKRVPQKTLAKYQTPGNAIILLQLEIVDLGLRISRYQYIERYRETFQAPSAEIKLSFVMHTHILRGSEIYVIMERCASLLEFLYDVSVDLSLNPTKASKSLEARFKKGFGRHLRERHRIVHGHERPTLVSRMLSIPPHQINRSEARAILQGVIEQITRLAMPLMQSVSATEGHREIPKEINDFRLKAVDQECLDMWTIFSESIEASIGMTKLQGVAVSST